jgi:acyl-coenzyme A synthetase/AMP-(fatty) acid ligase
VPALVDAAEGTMLEGEAEGALVITRPWPAQMRTVYGDHQALHRHLLQAVSGLLLQR